MEHIVKGPEGRTRRERQMRRLQLFGMGVASYLPTDFFLGYLWWIEAIDTHVFWLFMGAHLAINVGIFAMFATGLNRRLADRTLGIHQISIGIVSNLCVLAAIGPYRAVYLLFCITPFLFAAFKLSLRQIVYLTLLAQGGHLVLLLTLMFHDDYTIDIPYELWLWVMLTVELIWTGSVATVVAGMRRKMLKAYAEAERLSTSDPLTGVLNRRALFDSIDVALTEPRPSTGNESVIALIDLDYFKKINDTHGHDLGDQLLIAFTAAVKANIRATDRFGRYGGDEFVLFLRGTTREMATTVLERIQGAIAAITLPGLDSKPSASIGAITVVPGLSVESALQRADMMLYEVKRNGRGHVRLSDGDKVEPNGTPSMSFRPI